MPRFSVAFARRKSTADDIENAEVTPPGQSSFRVLERHDYSGVKSFDGGAKMARSSGALLPKPDFQADDNMFSDMKANRGSGLSNTTHTTSTDTSSRHSNASTAPSSADFSGGNMFHDDTRNGPPKSSSSDVHGRGTSNKSIGSKFLDRAGRTFSFGGQKKYTIPPPLEDPPMPDLPPPLPIMAEPGRTGSRGTTAYTQAPIIPRKEAPRDTNVIDLGSDFGSMFSGSGFDKRASMATLKNDDLASPRLLTGNPQGPPIPRSPDTTTPAEPLLGSWNTPKSNVIVDDYSSDKSSPTYESPPPVPNHSSPRYHSPARQPPARRSPPAEQPPARQPPMQQPRQPSMQPEEAQDNEDAKLLQETYTAIQLLSAEDDEFDDNPQPGRYRREEDSFTVVPRAKPSSNFNNGGNGDSLFDGNRARFSKPNSRYAPPQDGAPRNKVMTPAEFEKYREDKIRHDRTNSTAKDDDEEINYEDDEDEAEKSKQQAKQRRKQEAHMAVYRQQMMKVTGETNPTNGLGIPSSMSAPQLGHMKTPSLDPAAASAVSGASDEADDDEEVPLAILQAHGFPNKNRPPTRLSTVGSNPNMRASAMLMPGRPSSSMGDSAAAARRHSTLPAFARNLPQDPFIGASIAQPALRESLSFNDMGMGPKPPSPLPPGGLVGVIASEERQRAMRRGSPSVDPSRLMGSGYNTPGGPGIDPIAGIPPHLMYPQAQMGGGMPGMMPPMMPPPMLTVGDQAQIQMTQQMSQFMQMQMQFMQMMAANQNGSGPQQQQLQPPYQQPYGGGLMGNQSMVDISSRNSMIGEQTLEPRRGDYASMRTMSMVQPSSAPMANPGYAGSVRSSIHGYTPSIAPSERSNIGLPNRYRPVSQAVGPTAISHMQSQSFSGALSALADTKNKTSMRIVNRSASDDDDDEEGWEAMKNKREKKRSLWRSKKNLSSVI
ncbi:hypothetical protein V8C37DRAFT_233982 [Trichoderma ceciliae]